MRVLVVEDDLATIQLMRLTLQAFGHSVVSTTDVDDALRLIATERPHVVLSDLTLGGGRSGHALARAVRANPDFAAVAMMAITGATAPQELQAALDSGFSEIVTKPFDIDSLIERIARLGATTTQS